VTVANGSPIHIPPVWFALACVVSAELGYVSLTGGEVPVLWLPVGLVAGAIVVARRPQWLLLLAVGSAIMAADAFLHGTAPIRAIAQSAAYGAEALIAAWLLRRFTGQAFDLTRLSHVCALFGVAMIAPVAGGAAGAELTRLAGGITSFGGAWVRWWATDILGIVLGASLLFGWSRYPEGIGTSSRWRWLEAAATLAAITVISEAVFSNAVPRVFRAPPYVMPLLFLAVFRLGPFGTAAALTATLTVALPNAMRGYGPLFLPDATQFELVLRAQLVAGMAVFSFLLLAAVVAERRRIAQDRATLVTELQQALSEIKTLRGFVPICAWCHKIRDDAGFWQEIEAYLHTHTDAVVSHGICPTCTAREHLAIEEQRDATAAPPSTAS
jgi:hypothetical protein